MDSDVFSSVVEVNDKIQAIELETASQFVATKRLKDFASDWLFHDDVITISDIEDECQNFSSLGKENKKRKLADDDLPCLSAPVRKKKSSGIRLSGDQISSLEEPTNKTCDVAILPVIPDLIDVWKYHATSPAMMALIGPYKIRGSSLGFLKPGMEISDEVINAYMHTITKNNQERRVWAIDCFVWGTVMSKSSSENLNRLDMSEHDIILCPFNSGGHWELVVIFPNKKLVLYINPLGETTAKLTHYKQCWRSFIHRRLNLGLESSGPTSWRFETAKHTKQLDSTNCGVFVMKFAQMLVAANHPESPLMFNPRECDMEREIIGAVLLSESGDVRNICRECSMSYHPRDNWVQCNSCHWWLHHNCSSMAKQSIQRVSRESVVMLCSYCSGTDCASTPRVISNRVTRSTCNHDKPCDIAPFIFHKRTGQIKVCRGCNNKFEKSMSPPNNFVLQHKETYQFYDKKLKTERVVTGNRYYHVSANCILAKFHSVSLHPSMFCVPFGTTLSVENRDLFKANGVNLDAIENKSLF